MHYISNEVIIINDQLGQVFSSRYYDASKERCHVHRLVTSKRINKHYYILICYTAHWPSLLRVSAVDDGTSYGKLH
jgi:hypothetical protein